MIKLIGRTEYILVGVVVATDWYGNKGFAKLQIITDEKGFKEIEREPRQDYLRQGVMVNYVKFDVYRRMIFENDFARIIIEDKKPSRTIEDGRCELTEKEALFLSELDEIELDY